MNPDPQVSEEKNEGYMGWVPVEDLDELESLASTLNERYMPRTSYGIWKCGVDKKRRRLSFILSDIDVFSFKNTMRIVTKNFITYVILKGLGGSLAGARGSSSIYASLLTGLMHSLRHAEEDLNVRFKLDSSIDIPRIILDAASGDQGNILPSSYGVVYYKVFKKGASRGSPGGTNSRLADSRDSQRCGANDRSSIPDDDWSLDDIFP